MKYANIVKVSIRMHVHNHVCKVVSHFLGNPCPNKANRTCISAECDVSHRGTSAILHRSVAEGARPLPLARFA